MDDISIGKTSRTNKIYKDSFKEGEYFALKKQYENFMKKAAKSDFANSPALKQRELELLEILNSTAQKENLEEEIAFIESRKAVLQNEEEENTKSLAPAFYNDLAVNLEKTSSDDLSAILANCRNSKGEIDENTSKIIRAFNGEFKKNKADLPYLLNKCRDDNDEISQNKIQAVQILANAGLNINTIAQVLDEYTQIIPNISEESSLDDKSNVDKITETVNLDLCRELAAYKAKGLEDFEAVNLVRFLNDNYNDKNEVKVMVQKLLDAGISPDASIKILKNLTVNAVAQEDLNSASAKINEILCNLTDFDSKTKKKIISKDELNIASDEIYQVLNALKSSDKKKISPSAVNSIISLKKSLILNRNNEENERKNPINNLGVSIIQTNDSYMIMKDNEVIYSTFLSDENIDELKEKYDDLISKMEDELLINFSSEFIESNGEINSEGLRTTAALRRAGVTYDQLLSLTDFCLEKGNINSEKIKAISNLKKSGCLDTDIVKLINSFNKTSDGKYDEDDIKNACDYTSAIIGGEETAFLVKESHQNENIKDFFLSVAPYFNTKSNLIKFIPLIKNENGNVDKNAMNVIDNLADNFFSSKYNMKESDFIKYANDIISSAKNNGDLMVSDEGAGICSVMCQNEQSPDEILMGLKLCKDKNGKIDTRLADVLWEMSLKKADINLVSKFINSVCLDGDGNPNHYMANKMAEYMQQGRSLDEMMKFIMD